MNRTIIGLFVLGLLLAGAQTAHAAGPAVSYVFRANTSAKAAEVNANFQELADRIDVSQGAAAQAAATAHSAEDQVNRLAETTAGLSSKVQSVDDSVKELETAAAQLGETATALGTRVQNVDAGVKALEATAGQLSLDVQALDDQVESLVLGEIPLGSVTGAMMAVPLALQGPGPDPVLKATKTDTGTWGAMGYSGVSSLDGASVSIGVVGSTDGDYAVGVAGVTRGNERSAGVYGESWNERVAAVLGRTFSAGNASAVYGEHYQSGNFGMLGDDKYGVYGETALDDSAGVAGRTNGNANTSGVSGRHVPSGNAGWLGGPLVGVSGAAWGDGTAGVYGATHGIESAVGVRGDHLPSGNNGVIGTKDTGVWGRAVSPGGIGVYATYGLDVTKAYLATETEAGLFVGDVVIHDGNLSVSGAIGVTGDGGVNGNWSVGGDLGVNGTVSIGGDLGVSGTLYKASGSFKIDHPLDPKNKYLYHSFVESPDMKNIYDGVVTLDFKGEATIALPEWFSALNRDFRYQLTCIGGHASVYVAQEVVDNHFAIAGGTPGLKVSWQVTGIRHDPYAVAHRIPVEQEKPVAEKGTYLHPDIYAASGPTRGDRVGDALALGTGAPRQSLHE
jgi:hypothetical protein